MNLIREEIRKRIIRLRRELGYTVEYMAERLGIYDEDYIAFEAGEHNYETDYAILIVISHICGVSVEYLLGQEDLGKNAKEQRRLAECVLSCSEAYIGEIFSKAERMPRLGFEDMAEYLPVVYISSSAAILITSGLGAGAGYYVGNVNGELKVVEMVYRNGEVCFVRDSAVFPARYGVVSLVGKIIVIDEEGAL